MAVNNNFQKCLDVHSMLYFDSDSDSDGQSDFDDIHELLAPPPYKYEDIKEKIIHIPSTTVNKFPENKWNRTPEKPKANEITNDKSSKVVDTIKTKDRCTKLLEKPSKTTEENVNSKEGQILTNCEGLPLEYYYYYAYPGKNFKHFLEFQKQYLNLPLQQKNVNSSSNNKSNKICIKTIQNICSNKKKNTEKHSKITETNKMSQNCYVNNVDYYYYVYPGRNLDFQNQYLNLPLQQILQKRSGIVTSNNKSIAIIENIGIKVGRECKIQESTQKPQYSYINTMEYINSVDYYYYAYPGKNLQLFSDFRMQYLNLPLQQILQKSSGIVTSNNKSVAIIENIGTKVGRECKTQDSTQKPQYSYINTMEYKNTVDYYYYAYPGRNFQLFSDFRMQYLNLPVQQIVQKGEITSNNKPMVIIETNEGKECKIQKSNQMTQYSCINTMEYYYYAFRGQNFHHFLNFREQYFNLPLQQKFYKNNKILYFVKPIDMTTENSLQTSKLNLPLVFLRKITKLRGICFVFKFINIITKLLIKLILKPF